MPQPETYRDLYNPEDQVTREKLSYANGFGYDQGYDESRAEVLFAVRDEIDKGGDPRAFIERWLTKLRDTGRMPENFDADNPRNH